MRSDEASSAGPDRPRSGRGVCLWLTGPSGAGKSTLTNELVPILEAHGRTVSVLDVVPLLRKLPGERTSEGKLLRKAFVAGEVARHGGIAICVTVSARRSVREAAREVVGAERFLEILVEAPGEVTARRRSARGRRPPLAKRVKRWLAPVAAGVLYRGRERYETPTDPDLRIDSADGSPAEGASRVVRLLIRRGFLAAPLDVPDVGDAVSAG
jgi:sulfate adenylyltransferase